MEHLCPDCGSLWKCSDRCCPFPKSWPCAPKQLAALLGINGEGIVLVLRDLLELSEAKKKAAPVDWTLVNRWFKQHPSWSPKKIHEVSWEPPNKAALTFFENILAGR